MTKILAIIAGVFLLLPAFAYAQAERSYHYTNFQALYTVNKDSTVDVEEKLTYNFNGEYHLGWRGVALKGTDAITNVNVVDADTGQTLTYSRSRLDKMLTSSWQHYTTYHDNGAQNIEWYFNLNDTEHPNFHTWIIRYTLHGAISFLDDHDELYWNLFTDFDVPVDRAEVTIKLPEDVMQSSSSLAFYRNNPHGDISDHPTPSTYHFLAYSAAPGEDVTFAIGWQKGMIEQSAFWKDWFQLHWSLFAALIIFIASLVYAISYWLYQEHKNRGRGTIVPEYDPPLNLRPAMADLLAHGRLTSKAWAATIVDLAVRGYVKIKEDEPSWSQKYFNFLGKKDYILTRTAKDKSDLLPYEQKFLGYIFLADFDEFSTRELRKSQSRSQSLYYLLQSAEKELDKEIVKETGAYAVPPRVMRSPFVVFGLLPILAVVGLIFSILFAYSLLWVVGSLVLSMLVVLGVQRLPRLNREGHILKEKWLGFKMYLETAEKYRMQNLTPDLFEKYLPYAMIFGVEKKWARAFESLSMPPPQWYSGASAAYIGSSTSGSSSFSPGSFASGFSASFASSFASSGGGGASGGGGGAGGGGGGGGGGAS